MFGPPLSDQIAPMSYVQLQSMQEAAFPPGLHCYWKSNFLRALSDEAIETMIEEFQKVPSLTSVVGIEHLGGAVRRAGEDETAFDHRKAHFNLIIVGLWHDPAAKDQHIRWTRTFWNSIQPFSSGGVYVNYLGAEEDEGAERVAAAYGPVKHERLSALKKKYDPNNLFRLNQNIRPTS
jgi:FAD/FMN-containing dehydrogenase